MRLTPYVLLFGLSLLSSPLTRGNESPSSFTWMDTLELARGEAIDQQSPCSSFFAASRE
jgi:hypothetical protein